MFFQSSKQRYRFLLKLFLIKVLFGIKERMRVEASQCQPFCNVPSPWIEQGKNICYGALNSVYGKFVLTQDCQLYAIRLRHVSGSLSCDKYLGPNYFSKWGCHRNSKSIRTVVADPKSNKLWFPDITIDEDRDEYEIDGFGSEDDLLVMKKRGNFTKGDELQIWYTEDWIQSIHAYNNAGLHCIDVDISCLI